MISYESGTTVEGKPFCKLSWGREEGQMSPDEMRALARDLIACAEAAESDAALLLFCRHDLEVGDTQIAGLLFSLRKRRDQARVLAGDDG